ncbi:hypothetical protein EG68_11596 [Paragonimus skrjabini miyazakii]|uniref:Uncharacterized protein n=1 Tax=Paragonimus skrjabini miyazakii TaxID=59628 RepID=A0A8S9YE79_9TREM|nr:hypothetical protein EG68_11596 [Paragonimus skrjabini miyazakii]
MLFYVTWYYGFVFIDALVGFHSTWNNSALAHVITTYTKWRISLQQIYLYSRLLTEVDFLICYRTSSSTPSTMYSSEVQAM